MRLYFNDLDENHSQNLGGEPLQEGTETFFAPHNAEFRTHRDGLLVRVTVCVAPSVDVEIRRIKITNDGAFPRRVRWSHPMASRCWVMKAPISGTRRLASCSSNPDC